MAGELLDEESTTYNIAKRINNCIKCLTRNKPLSGNRFRSADDSKQPDEKQERQSNGANAVRPHQAIAGRPWEQQHIEQRPNLLRPKQPRHSECEANLDNATQRQDIHGHRHSENIFY
jgi:hypothetical protein